MDEELKELVRNQIAAANRTTHAIRSLALYILGYIPVFVLGAIVAASGYATALSADWYEDYDRGMGMVAFGGAIIAIGSIVVVILAFRELMLSKVPGVATPKAVSNLENATRSFSNNDDLLPEGYRSCKKCGADVTPEMTSCRVCLTPAT